MEGDKKFILKRNQLNINSLRISLKNISKYIVNLKSQESGFIIIIKYANSFLKK